MAISGEDEVIVGLVTGQLQAYSLSKWFVWIFLLAFRTPELISLKTLLLITSVKGVLHSSYHLFKPFFIIDVFL